MATFAIMIAAPYGRFLMLISLSEVDWDTLMPGPVAPKTDKLSMVTYISALTQLWTVRCIQASKR